MSHAFRAPHYGVLSESERLHTLSSSDAREWVATRQQQAERYARNLLIVQNDYAPIHKLPDESLVEVFHYAISDCYPTMRWIWLSWVCHYWRSLMLGTPKFWTHPGIKCNNQLLKLFLKRSVNLPVDIRVKEPPMDPDLVSTVRSHAHQIRSLELNLNWRSYRHWELLLSQQENPLVMLEVLTLCEPWGLPDSSVHMQAPIQRFPNLRSLFIDGLALPWTSLALVGLKALHLKDLGWRCSPTLKVFLDILDACPDLERLTADSALKNDTDDTTQYPDPGRIIALPRMKYMRLSDDLEIVSLSLAHLSTPSTAHVEIVVETDYASIIDGPSVFSLDASKILGLTAVKSLVYDFSFMAINICGSTIYPSGKYTWEEPTVALQVSPPLAYRHRPVDYISYDDQVKGRLALLHLLPDVYNALRPCSISELYVSSKVTMDINVWRCILSALPSLVDLTIATHYDDCDIYEVLASPSADGSDMLCPRLEEFHIHGWTMDVPLISCLRYRTARGSRLRLLAFHTPCEVESRYGPYERATDDICCGITAEAQALGLVDAVYCAYCNDVLSVTDHDDEVQQVGEQLLVDSP